MDVDLTPLIRTGFRRAALESGDPYTLQVGRGTAAFLSYEVVAGENTYGAGEPMVTEFFLADKPPREGDRGVRKIGDRLILERDAWGKLLEKYSHSFGGITVKDEGWRGLRLDAVPDAEGDAFVVVGSHRALTAQVGVDVVKIKLVEPTAGSHGDDSYEMYVYAFPVSTDPFSDPGATLGQIFPHGAFDELGFREEDRLRSINGRPLRNLRELDQLVKAYRDGTPISAIVARRSQGGAEITLQYPKKSPAL